MKVTAIVVLLGIVLVETRELKCELEYESPAGFSEEACGDRSATTSRTRLTALGRARALNYGNTLSTNSFA